MISYALLTIGLRPLSSSPPLRSRSTLPLLFSVVVVDLIGFGVVLPVLPFYAESYGASASVLGLLLTVHAAMQLVFAPIWGRLSDRVGRRPVMLATMAGTGASLLWLGLADSLVWIFAARLASGIFAANISVASAYISDVTEEQERTRWMGMLGASFGLGFVLGPAIGGLLAPRGLSVPILFAAALAALNVVFALRVLREPQVHRASEESPRDRRELLRSARVRRLCLANLTFSLAVTQLESIFAFFMMDRFDYDARQVAFILVFMAVLMGGIQGGAMRGLAARLGERRLLLLGSFLMAVAFAGIPWAGGVALLLVPLSLSAVGRAISQPSLMSLVSVAANPSERGAVMGTFQSAASLARVLGPLAAGLLYDWRSASPFVLASVLMLVTLAVSFGVAPKPGAETARRSTPT